MGNQETSTSSNILRRLEILSKLGQLSLASIGLIYIIGFVIVNSYLLKFGTTLRFANAKYLSAGILFAAVMAVELIVFYFVFWRLRYESKKSTRKRRKSTRRSKKSGAVLDLTTDLALLFFWIFATLFLLWIILYFPSSAEMLTSFIKKPEGAATTEPVPAFWTKAIIWIFVTLWTIFYGHSLFKSFKEKKSPHPLTPVFAFICALALPYTFGSLFYPYIDQAIGGGRLSSIRVIPEPHSMDLFRKLHIQVDSTGILGRVFFLEQSPQMYRILIESDGYNAVMELPKDHIFAVLFERPTKKLIVTPQSKPPNLDDLE